MIKAVCFAPSPSLRRLNAQLDLKGFKRRRPQFLVVYLGVFPSESPTGGAELGKLRNRGGGALVRGYFGGSHALLRGINEPGQLDIAVIHDGVDIVVLERRIIA